MSTATTNPFWYPTRPSRSRNRGTSPQTRAEPATRAGRLCRAAWELTAIVGIPLGIILAGVACAGAVVGSGLLLERLIF